MMTQQEHCIHLIKATKEYFDRSTRPLKEEHSAFRPSEGMFTVAEQVAHTAQTVEWFFQGVLTAAGFDLDFEKIGREVAAVKSLDEARKWMDRAFASAAKEMESRPWSDWEAVLPDNPILGPVPRWTILDAIVDHTAHHRGALTAYSRQLGMTPPMPYMDM